MKLSLFTVLLTTLLLSGCTKKYQILSSAKDGNDIVFNIGHGEQKIKAACNSAGTACQDLALRVGQPVDCYLNPNHPEPYEYGKHRPLNLPAGLVCHVRQGKGEYFVMHLRDCVDLRKVDEPDVVLHQTKNKKRETFIGETFSSVTLKCTRLSGCNDNDSSRVSLHANYGEFEAFIGPAKGYSDLEKEAQQSNSAFVIVWHPAKEWISQSLSDADELKETEDELESDDGTRTVAHF
jgi:outer membrane murein-binding lipoprotein Lpp